MLLDSLNSHTEAIARREVSMLVAYMLLFPGGHVSLFAIAME